MTLGGWAACFLAAFGWGMAPAYVAAAQPAAPDESVALEGDCAAVDAAASAETATERLGDAAIPSQTVLPAGTPVTVTLVEDLSTLTNKVGDRFNVRVAQDVMVDGIIVIPAGANGCGEITFATNKGSFGKPGILGISLRYLQLGDRQFALNGRYREEGRNKNGATAATMFAVGVFATFIKGKPAIIPSGRELHARTGELIAAPQAPPDHEADASAATFSLPVLSDIKTGE